MAKASEIQDFIVYIKQHPTDNFKEIVPLILKHLEDSHVRLDIDTFRLLVEDFQVNSSSILSKNVYLLKDALDKFDIEQLNLFGADAISTVLKKMNLKTPSSEYRIKSLDTLAYLVNQIKIELDEIVPYTFFEAVERGEVEELQRFFAQIRYTAQEFNAWLSYCKINVHFHEGYGTSRQSKTVYLLKDIVKDTKTFRLLVEQEFDATHILGNNIELLNAIMQEGDLDMGGFLRKHIDPIFIEILSMICANVIAPSYKEFLLTGLVSASYDSKPQTIPAQKQVKEHKNVSAEVCDLTLSEVYRIRALKQMFVEDDPDGERGAAMTILQRAMEKHHCPHLGDCMASWQEMDNAVIAAGYDSLLTTITD